LEYNEATCAGKPQLIYFIDEDKHAVPPSLVDRGEDAEALAQFKAKVSKTNIISHFTSVENLRYQVIRDLIRLFGDLGWWEEHISNQDRPESSTDVTSESSNLAIQLDGWDSSGMLSISTQDLDREQLAEIGAVLLVAMFERGDFSALRGVTSLEAKIWNKLQLLVAVRGVDEVALSNAIREVQDARHLRLLIDLAGVRSSRKMC
jgi:hypothetical protein